MTRTKVCILGAGPAGLLLGHLLDRAGIDNVIVEARSRTHVEGRIRAGVMEHQSAALLDELGLGDRMAQEGMPHEGVWLAFGGERHRIDLTALTGKTIMVYGQHEVVRDLIAARLAAGRPLAFETEVVALEGIDSAAPVVTCRKADGTVDTISCDIVAGCDGFHGPSRAALPADVATVYERVYPYGWLGILAEAPPTSHELVYSGHENGFALFSMRSPRVTRLYLQCEIDEDLGRWPDERIWDELETRLSTADGWRPSRGPIIQKGVTAMRSFVVEPMRHGRLFLAGDAAHIVPPTGAKGMNLAIADVRVLARAVEAWYREGTTALLDSYSATCLDRIWKVQRFSWWMTTLFHRAAEETPFDLRRRMAELDYVIRSRAAATALAENYVGLPFEA